MLTAILLSSLAAQSGTPVLIDQVLGFQLQQAQGAAVVDMGDLDGDGTTDYATTSGGFDFQRTEWGFGRVEVLSGATQELLFARDARGDIDFSIGTMLLNMGDINHDGFNDLYISAVGPVTAYVVSGLDGSILYRMLPPFGTAPSPSSIDNLDDLNGDGVQEFVVGYWAETFSDSNSGRFIFQAGAVRIFDGASGAEILYIHGQTDFQGLGKQVRAVGDLDGDGLGDLALVDAGFGFHNFAVRAYSSSDGSQIFERTDLRIDTLSPISLDGMDDFNGDGIPEILLSAKTRPNALGHVAALTFILSGATGSPLKVIRGRSYAYRGGFARTIDDMNQDGIRDFAIGEPLKVGGVDYYSVRILSGADASQLAVINTGVEEYLGAQFAPVGDLDGDGLGELMIGLPSSPLTAPQGFSMGEVQIYALH